MWFLVPWLTRFSCMHFYKISLCELHLADFSFKRFSFIESPSVWWFCGGGAVKSFGLILPSSWMIIDVQELLINVSGVKCSASSRSLLVDFCVNVFPYFLITLKEITDLLRLHPLWHLYRIQHELRGIELAYICSSYIYI